MAAGRGSCQGGGRRWWRCGERLMLWLQLVVTCIAGPPSLSWWRRRNRCWGRGRRQRGGGGRLTCRGSPCASQGRRTDPGEDDSLAVKPELTYGTVQVQVILLAGIKTAGRERHLQGEQVGLESGVQLFKTSTCRAEQSTLQCSTLKLLESYSYCSWRDTATALGRV